MEVEPWPNNIKYKMNCYCDLFNEHIKNLDNILRTCKKYNGNTLEIGKKTPPTPLSKPKKLKTKTTEPSHWLHVIFISKPICDQP